MAERKWFAVRTFVMNDANKPWGPHDLESGEVAYEERITIWQAEGLDAAIALAEQEAQGYVDGLGGTLLDLSQAYCIDGEPSVGAEVFSLIRKSTQAADDYLDQHFDTGAEYQSRIDR